MIVLSSLRLCILTVASAGWLLATALTGHCDEPRVSFPHSLAPLPVLSGTRTAMPRLVASRVGSLTAAQLAAPLNFDVSLKMRHFEEFQTRVSNGETVPFAEMEAKYLPLPADYAAVRAWLVGQGFTVTMDDARYLGVFAQGTAAQVQASFGVEMQSVTVDGVTYAAATTAPSLPASIAAPVLGINGLQPYLQFRKHSRLTPAAVGPEPQTGNAPPYLVSEIRKAYDAANLAVSGTSLTGANQKIAIIIDTFPLSSDLTQFWNANGIPQSLGNIEQINVPGGTLNATSGEETLDVEWASSTAPGCKVRVYASDNLNFSSINQCLSQVATDVSGTNPVQPQLHELSLSLGLGETYLGAGSSIFATEAQYFATIANGSTAYGGVSVFVSSGDAGSTPDSSGHSSGGPLQAEYESTDPNVTGVGGTQLKLNTSTGQRNTEVVWNDGAGSSTGGGTSIQFGRPTWQVGTGVPSGSQRLAPDVALVAAGSSAGLLIFNGGTYYVSGTSWSSPTWAAFTALLNQGRGVSGRLPLGLLNPRIYPLLGTSNFYDITSGNNAVGGSANGQYAANVGYDECTGLGVPDVAVLLNTLLGPTITSFSPTQGGVGARVTITGNNFYTGSALPLKVTFNGKTASVISSSRTQITVTVPGGATSGPVAVTSLGDLTTSTGNFTVTSTDAKMTVANAGTVSQGDSGDPFTLTVTNLGTGPTSGLVIVTAIPPDNTRIGSVSGSGWSCTADSNSNNWICTRADSLATGSSFPVLTALLNVSPAAPAQATVFTGHVVANGDINAANDYDYHSFILQSADTTPIQQWRYDNFGSAANSGNAADTANPAGDGINNLLKYALNLNPLATQSNPVTVDTTTGYLRLTTPKRSGATDVTYSVQVNDDLTNAAGWTTSGTVELSNTSTQLQVRDGVPLSGGGKRFIRLQISR